MPTSNRIQRRIDKALDGAALTRADALVLMEAQLNSDDCYALMAAANRLTHQLAEGRGTIYSQVGINVWPCPENCDFCYLATKHGLVSSRYELTPDEVVARARAFEAAGADEVYLMTTANYPVDRFLAIGKEVRRALQPQTELVANIGDFGTREGYALRDAGFCGVYHVDRFREGRDTAIAPERRRSTFTAIREVGLDLRYCVEPIGPEHSDAEIVEQMVLARAFGARILSVMRRIPVPGTPFERTGRLTESQVAKIVAIARLFLGRQIRQMGVHEPSVLGLRAGAQRICAEIGMNPRDRSVDTATGRGISVDACERMLSEAGFCHPRRLQLAGAARDGR